MHSALGDFPLLTLYRVSSAALFNNSEEVKEKASVSRQFERGTGDLGKDCIVPRVAFREFGRHAATACSVRTGAARAWCAAL